MNTVATKNTDEAALISLAEMRHELLEYRRNVKRLRDVIEPILGFRWNMSLICAVGADKFNDLLSIVKSPDFPLVEIDKLRKIFLCAFFDPSLIFIDHWEVWRCCITKFHLCEIRPFAGWLKIANALSLAHILAPSDLAALSFSECAGLDEVNASNGDIILLRQSDLCWMGDNPQAQSFFLSKREAASRDLIVSLRVDSVPETTAFKEWGAERIFLGLPADFDKLPPLTKNRILANSGNRTSEIEHFLELGGRVNILRSAGARSGAYPQA